MVYVYIGVGGFVGAVFRYAVGIFGKTAWIDPFPVGTFLINLTGCILLGFLVTLFLEILVINPDVRAGVTTGFLGGFTTFSTFVYESLTLLSKGLWEIAFLYIFLSVLGGIAAAWLGVQIARLIVTISQRARRQASITQANQGE